MSKTTTTYMYDSFEPDDFRMINQAGVRQACFPPDVPYAACWDALLTSEGRVFVAAGTEGAIGWYVKLCEYDAAGNDFIEIFDGRDLFMAPERAITSSKFHFSMNEMEDGRLIAAAHTTDKAPSHPAWLFKQYYHHLWEGYPGSPLVIYDPASGHAEHLGMVTPRETIYGGVYNPRDRGYYCLGFARGHLYRYSLDTRRLTDFGKVTEWKTFGLHLGPDGNVYGASRSGFLFRLDTRTDELVDLNCELLRGIDESRRAPLRNSRSMAGAVTIPGSSKFLFSVFSSPDLYCHDTATHETEYLGCMLSADRYCRTIESHECVYSLKLDRDGVLWYAVTCYPHSDINGDLTFRRAASLMRWDVQRGGRPECLGVIGTPRRVNATVPTLLLDAEGDRLFLTDSNHGEDGMSLLAIDLRRFRPHMHEQGPPCEDPFMIRDQPRYLAMSNAAQVNHDFVMANSPDLAARDIIPVRLWRSCPPESSAVVGLAWNQDGTLGGLCGGNGTPRFAFRIASDGELLAFEPLDALDDAERTRLLEQACPARPRPDPALELPYRCGRRYKAVPHAAVRWNRGRELVGTLDGMLAIVDGSDVFALGPAAPNGPIHDLTADSGGTVCYGVAGDPEDLGMVFRYDDKRGLRQLGHLCVESRQHGVASSDALSSIALNQAADTLAIGSNDRLGVVCLVAL